MHSSNVKIQEAMMILKNSHIPPSITYISMNELNHDEKIIAKLTKYFGADHSKWPPTLIKSVLNEESRDPPCMIALGMAITYLE